MAEGWETMSMFRFQIGQHVRTITHPAKPLGTIVERWTGEELRDVYGENIYSVRSVVTKQRESSLAAVPPSTPAASGSAGCQL